MTRGGADFQWEVGGAAHASKTSFGRRASVSASVRRLQEDVAQPRALPPLPRRGNSAGMPASGKRRKQVRYKLAPLQASAEGTFPAGASWQNLEGLL